VRPEGPQLFERQDLSGAGEIYWSRPSGDLGLFGLPYADVMRRADMRSRLNISHPIAQDQAIFEWPAAARWR